MEDKDYLWYYRNILDFKEKYFPYDKLGTSAKLLLLQSTRVNYELLEKFENSPKKNKFFRRDLLRAVCKDMTSYGFRSREIQ